MHPVGGKAQQHIAFGHACGQFCAAFHRAHGKACKVKIALVIHARHFRRLAADQRATRLHAAFGDAVDDAGGLVDLELDPVEFGNRHRAFVADQLSRLVQPPGMIRRAEHPALIGPLALKDT